MTILLVGGAFQDKYEYACRTFHLQKEDFLPHNQLSDANLWKTCKAVDNLQDLLRDEAQDPTKLLPLLLGKVVICDEVGGGIVPIDGAERAWRERVGRLCCDLAAQADRVERIYMGMPERIK